MPLIRRIKPGVGNSKFGCMRFWDSKDSIRGRFWPGCTKANRTSCQSLVNLLEVWTFFRSIYFQFRKIRSVNMIKITIIRISGWACGFLKESLFEKLIPGFPFVSIFLLSKRKVTSRTCGKSVWIWVQTYFYCSTQEIVTSINCWFTRESFW